jgi:hypothetical protein
MTGDFDDNVMRIGSMVDENVENIRAIGYDPVQVRRELVDEPMSMTPGFLRVCDGSTVSTPALGEVMGRYMRTGVPVMVVPNAIAPERYVEARLNVLRGVPPITIGWAGTLRWRADFEATGMAAAWGRIARRYAAVTFVTIGGKPLFLEGRVEPARIVAWPHQVPDMYPSGLANIDIACTPLAPTEFNMCPNEIPEPREPVLSLHGYGFT